MAFLQSKYSSSGYTYFALIHLEKQICIGYCGLLDLDVPTPYKNPVEIGWKIAHEFQRNGYAYEAAKEMLKVGFQEKNLNRIFATTATLNKPSINLTQKLGFTYLPECNYAHPRVNTQSPLSKHVLYMLTKNSWENKYLEPF